MKKECLRERVDLIMIERNGGAFIETNLNEFLTLIRSLIDPRGFTELKECLYCGRIRKTKRFSLKYCICGGHRAEDMFWDYCKESALTHAHALLNGFFSQNKHVTEEGE